MTREHRFSCERGFSREPGFSIVELLIAMGLVAVVTAGVFGALNPAQSVFSAQLEAADMQQRLRAAAAAITADLVMAGAGPSSGARAGTINDKFAAVLPYRRGNIRPDPSGAYRTSTITVLYVGATDAQTTTAVDLTSYSSAFTVRTDTACPVGKPACGFQAGDTALIFDAVGRFDTFSVTSVSGDGGAMTLNAPPGSPMTMYPRGSMMMKAIDRTYALKADAADDRHQLVSYDGGAHGDVPVADHIAYLGFAYYGDPQPPTLRTPTCPASATATCTSYGPPPPPPGVQTTAYPPGENCVFKIDPVSGRQVPRLDVLGGDSHALTRLTPGELTDGPWCPDADSANRFDADLLRIRTIAVTLRVESAVEALRGPAGALFTRAGTAADATKFLPDQEVSFRVSPRNLNLAR